MDYMGIDVGAKKYYVVRLSDEARIVNEGRMETCKEVFDILHGKHTIVAIDAPSDLCKPQNERRQCEVALGIGGYFKTPKKRKWAKSWMQSGFDLWDFLRKRGYKKTTSKRTQKDDLIEVHPTVIFKALCNPKIEPKLWISRRYPVRKSLSKGKFQRRDILNNIFTGQEDRINKFSIDYIDALISAYTAKQSHLGKVRQFGDDLAEGQIWIPNAC